MKHIVRMARRRPTKPVRHGPDSHGLKPTPVLWRETAPPPPDLGEAALRPHSLGFGLVLAAVLVCTPNLASGQSPGAGPTIYTAADYSAFSPQTALDMVQRTPGFVLDEGDADLRGFGAAGGNVIIDGARPSSKSGLIEALSRIPAHQVERIELIRNSTTAESQGRSLILNVVRRPGETSGSWQFQGERNGDGVFYPRLDASYARHIGNWRTAIKAKTYWEEFPSRTLRLNRNADGELLTATASHLPSTLSETSLSGEASRPVAGGLLNLTGRVGYYHLYFDQPGDIFLGRLPDGTADQTLLNQRDLRRWSFELGSDWTRLVGDWRIKTLGLVSYRDTEEHSQERRATAAGNLMSRRVVASTAKPLEVVGRVTASSTSIARLRPEFGAEVAYNHYDRTFALALDRGDGLQTIAVPASNVAVEERRAELFANLAWTLSPRWTLETSAALEASEIGVSGDASQVQTFVFFKPAMALAWRATERLQLRLGARHTVGQLDFSDFAASTDLTNNTTAAGNPDLGPDQTTRYYVAIDYRGKGDLAARLEGYYEDRSDVLEQIILPSGAPGLANAGDARFSGLKGSLTLPLDRLLKGARLTAEGEVKHSQFLDPITQRDRSLSFVYSPEFKAEFRHDPPHRPISWGLSVELGDRGDLYLVDQIDALRADEVFGGFVETTAIGGFKTRLAIRNADTQSSRRLRTFYDPDRRGTISGTEERFTRSPVYLTLTLSDTF